MAPNTLAVSLHVGPGTSDEHRGAESVSMLAAVRQLFLPPVFNLTPTTLFFISTLAFCTVLYLLKSKLAPHRASARPIDLFARPLRLSGRGKASPSTSEEGEEEKKLGLDGEPRHPASSSPSLLSSSSSSSPHETSAPPSVPEAPDFSAMARSAPPTPAVLQPRACTPTPHVGPSATVSLRQGRYVGVLLPASAFSGGPYSSSSCSSSSLPRAVEAWRGIPYAQSTGGQNRFRPPVPLPPEEEVREAVFTTTADRLGQVCPGSMAGRADASFEGEDCLNLNVYRPVGTSSSSSSSTSKLPVIVYVHGGAFNAGAGTERDMASFVAWAGAGAGAGDGVLAVSFNYRVGALGFPSSAAADREGCLNLGLRDQRLLFEWVRDNIGAFGGDAGRVTLMGMSAGAHSIGYHLQCYTDPATAPFHGAIMESGGATARATLSSRHPRTEAQWREFLLEAGLQQPDSIPPGQLFARLRALPLDALLRASGTVFARYQDPIRWPFQPVVEEECSSSGGGRDGMITDLPIAKFRRGEFLRVPVLTGFNTNEGTVFCSPRVDRDDEVLGRFATMVPGLTDADLAALGRLYPDPVAGEEEKEKNPYAEVPPGFGRQWSRYEAAYAHYAYICPVLQSGHFYSNAGVDGRHHDNNNHNRSNNNSLEMSETQEKDDGGSAPPIWVYHFAALSRPDFGGKANHVDEAVVVAHDMRALAPFPGLVRTADAMHGAWVRFVATGDPNPPSPSPAISQSSRPASSSSTTTITTPYWPRFTSPLVGDTTHTRTHTPGRLVPRVGGDGDGRSSSSRYGRVMLFGAGNDERMGGAGRRDPGTPARVAGLTAHEVDQCRFWWERVELSEGMGRRLSSSSGGGVARAKL